MANEETTVKMSKWIVNEIDTYVKKNKQNMSEYPSKRNFVDRAVMQMLLDKGVKLNK